MTYTLFQTKPWVATTSACMLAWGLVACSSAPPALTPGSMDDASITAAIKAKLVQDKLTARQPISVDTIRGHVTLTGKVHPLAAKQRAESLARTVPQVRSVRNALQMQTVR